MVSPRTVASRFISSSISLVNGPVTPQTVPGQPPSIQKPEKIDPKKQEELKRLQRKKELTLKPIDRQIKQLQQQQPQTQQFKRQGADSLNPNDDPTALYGQVRPLLTKMGLANKVINNKTQLMMGETQGTNSLYCVYLRREQSIITDTIDRIKRNESNFKEMKWTANAISIYVWYPYSATPAAIAPVAPPGAPGAP